MFVSRQQCMLSVSADGTQVGLELLLSMISSTANSNTVFPEYCCMQRAHLQHNCKVVKLEYVLD
jgi:hypothetical protein